MEKAQSMLDRQVTVNSYLEDRLEQLATRNKPTYRYSHRSNSTIEEDFANLQGKYDELMRRFNSSVADYHREQYGVLTHRWLHTIITIYHYDMTW